MEKKHLQYGFGFSLNKYVNLPFYTKEPLAISSYLPVGPTSGVTYTNRVANGLKYNTLFLLFKQILLDFQNAV